jgi:hypothetical protein
MTDTEADKILAANQDNKILQQIGRKFDAFNNEKLDVLFASGRLSEQEYEAIKNTFEHWAPLKREGFSDMPGRGRGVQVIGKDIKVRGGSTKRAVDILANAIASYETSVINARKQDVAKAFLNLVKMNPNDGVWQIETIRKVPGYDDAGNIIEHNDMRQADNELKVKLHGKIYSITAHNIHSMRIVSALKNDASQAGPIVNALGKLNRYLSAVNTMLSPEFIITNLSRDVQTAFVNLSDTEAAKVKGRIMREIPKAMKGMHNLWRGNKTHEWAKWARRFESAGGKIGWIDSSGDMIQRVKKLEKEIDLFRDGNVTKKTIHNTLQAIEDYNSIVENAVRLSAFKNAVESGLMTEKKAALMAKGLTVNFQQKGTFGQLINSLYLFANAGIQGSTRIIGAMKRSPKVRKMVYGGMLASVAIAIANRGIGGEDDDGIDYYDKIEDYIKERNLILMIPGGKGDFVKIPLPWGYNVFWVAGSEIGDALTKPGYEITGGMSRVMAAVSGAFNPLQSASLAQSLSPTVLDPVIQIAENKSWSGNPLMPEGNPFAKVKAPDSELYWKSARKPSVFIAKGMNALTGGDVVKSGAIDVSPETLDLIWDTFTGSAGRFLADTLEFPINAATGELTVSKTPGLRRVYGAKSMYIDDTLYKENVGDVFEAAERVKEYPRDTALRRNKALRLTGIAKATERNISRLYKQKKLARTQAQKDRIQERIDNEKRRFNAQYNRIVKE